MKDLAAMTVATVALIGFGEVGRALAADLKDVAVRVFDIRRPPESLGSAAEAARGADLVICAVTAAQTVAAAQSVAAGLKPGAWFMDLNADGRDEILLVYGSDARWQASAMMLARGEWAPAGTLAASCGDRGVAASLAALRDGRFRLTGSGWRDLLVGGARMRLVLAACPHEFRQTGPERL